ncbi:S-DNA-T family DNA segregation ATPase FtsK/SpoIIIE [Frigoribacterium sp. PhB160]|nr:S-DNA-T family DNA segregation ATPase FtsK/SpoIIIE [Frigoribacterium sp. PhB160]
MRLAGSILHVPTDRRADVAWEVGPETTVGEMVRVAARVLGMPDDRGAGPITVDGEPVQPGSTVSDGRMLEGCTLTFGAPPRLRPLPADLTTVRVVGGPGAGTLHVVDAGVVVIGSSPRATVRLDPETVPAVAALAEVDGNGGVTLTPVAGEVVGDDLRPASVVTVDGHPLTEPVVIGPSAVVAIGDVLLSVATGGGASAAIRLAEGGGRLQHARPPRLLPESPRTEFRYPPEPPAPPRRPLPLVAAAAPLAMAAVMVTVTESRMFLAFGLMSPVVLIGNHLYDKRNGRVSHRRKAADHAAAKAAVTADASDAVTRLQDELRSSCPDAAAVADIALRRRARLWERRRGDPDHLVVRVGTADRPSGVTIDDPDQLEHRRTVARPAADVPVTIELGACGVVGFHGPVEQARALAAWVVSQLGVLQSPRDLEVVVLTEPDAERHWGWLAWLPHARPDGLSCRARIGTDAESVSRRLSELVAEIESRHRALREARGAGGGALAVPDVVVVVDGSRRLRALPGLLTVLKDGPAVGVHAVCLDVDLRSLPEECSTVVAVGRRTHGVAVHRGADVQEVRADVLPEGWHDLVARSLAPVDDVDDGGEAGGLPSRSRLLEVLGLDDPTADAVLDRWRRLGPSTTVLVGEGLDGPFSFDLRRDGPHGLVAGTTGSGKSELLQSVVASLASVNSPESMTFVLVDYKGGAAFRDCAPLPHTVGMVTDLDAHLVERALTSLRAELHRRERLLAAAAAKDVEDYLDVRRRDPRTDLEALPRLLIVIDEFASMARELPDFVTGLVDVAQRGRSLGIHLLLATQRPAGVVSSEIRANTNLRIALRVTDAVESSDVIDAPDAARLSKSTPGRALIRLGAGALLPFQAGRVGGRSVGRAAAVPDVRCDPMSWPDLGRPVPTPTGPTEDGDPADTDLVRLVSAAAEAERRRGGRPPHSPWLPALPALLPLDDLDVDGGGVDGGGVGGPDADDATARRDRRAPSVGGLRLPFGLEDHPASQRQVAAVFDLDAHGHLFVAGAPRSGRSQVLRALATSVIRRTSCADVHLYGLDCGSGALLPLVDAPHTGAVVRRTETERARRLLARLVAETLRRQGVLAAGGWGGVGEQRRSSPGAALPHIVLLLDQWDGFVATLGELDNGELVDLVTLLLREGAAVGVHVVVTGDRQLVSGRVGLLVEDKLLLRLAERTDYALAGIDPRSLPEDVVDGRCFRSGSAIELQIAVVGPDASGRAQADVIRADAERAAERDRDVVAARRPFRLDRLEGPLGFDEAWARRPPGSAGTAFAMVGVGGDALAPVGPDLDGDCSTFLVLGPARSGRSTVLLSMVRSLLLCGSEVVVVAPRASPLRRLEGTAGVVAVLRSADVTGEELEQCFPTPARAAPAGAVTVADGVDSTPVPRRVLVLDDGDLLKDGPSAPWLARFARGCADGRHGLLAAGSVAELGFGFSGWHVDLRRARCGAVLSPQATSDGDHVGVRLAKSATSHRVRPGIAHVHVGDGETVQVQVPLA